MSPTTAEPVRSDQEHLIHPLHHPVDSARTVIYVRGRGVMLQDIDVPEWQASIRAVGRAPHVSKHQDAAQLRASGHGR